MTLYILICHVRKMKLLFNTEMKVYYVTQAFAVVANIKMMRPNYIPELRDTKSHSLQVYLGAWVKIETDIENQVC